MATQDRTSAIAQHLRHYYRTPQINTQAPYSYSVPEPASSTDSTRRHRAKKQLRSKLKDLVLKVPAQPANRKTVTKTAPKRPPLMRMKDSDDYITARAANPWTGVVSPSIGSPSPRTPETPGEALLSHREVPVSPTTSARARPALCRAAPNEGRKVSAGSIHKWRAGLNGWMSETVVASPRQTDATAGAGIVLRGERRGEEDRFVMHMPSAREPQPYAYPGCSEAEINAFEYYKHTTRKVSGEGYGERSTNHDPHAWAGVRKPLESRVSKPEYGLGPVDDHSEISAATFAPFASPRTPLLRTGDGEPTLLRTVKALRMREADPLEIASTAAVRRKPVKSTQSCSLGCEREADGGACQPKELRSGTAISLSSDEHLFYTERHDADRQTDAAEADPNSTSEILITTVIYALRACRKIQPPRFDVLSALRSPNATPQQKVDALRALLALAAQMLALLMVWSVVWRLSMAMMQILELVLWPLVMPFKVLRWIACST